MLFDRVRPHVFREHRISPQDRQAASDAAIAAVERRAARTHHLQAHAIHVAHDGTRVITVEAWSDLAAFRKDVDSGARGTNVYAWAATGGVEPTPVENPDAGVIVIDIFPIWRPLLRPVSAFNIKNGEAFNREPGCISTTVLRGIGAGSIATYARWRSAADFAAAFSKLTGRRAATPDDINRQAARMTFGLIRPDYHTYDLIASTGDNK